MPPARKRVNYKYTYPERYRCASSSCITVLDEQNIDGVFCSHKCAGQPEPPKDPRLGALKELQRRYAQYVRIANDPYEFLTRAARRKFQNKARWSAKAIQRIEGKESSKWQAT